MPNNAKAIPSTHVVPAWESDLEGNLVNTPTRLQVPLVSTRAMTGCMPGCQASLDHKIHHFIGGLELGVGQAGLGCCNHL